MQNKAKAADGRPAAKQAKKAATVAAPQPDFPDFDMDSGEALAVKPANKRLSVERIYQKKSQLEHILLRPDTYIGSVESVTQVKYRQLCCQKHVVLY